MSLDRSHRFLISISLVLGLASVAGCAAGRAGIQVQDAIAARDSAIAEGADQDALYEFTMASRYLDKAWEEMGTGQYRMSVELSKKSAEWSDQAVVQMQRGARELDLDLTDMRDAVPPPAVPPDTPAVSPSPAPSVPAPPAPIPSGPIEPDPDPTGLEPVDSSPTPAAPPAVVEPVPAAPAAPGPTTPEVP